MSELELPQERYFPIPEPETDEQIVYKLAQIDRPEKYARLVKVQGKEAVAIGNDLTIENSGKRQRPVINITRKSDESIYLVDEEGAVRYKRTKPNDGELYSSAAGLVINSIFPTVYVGEKYVLNYAGVKGESTNYCLELWVESTEPIGKSFTLAGRQDFKGYLAYQNSRP